MILAWREFSSEAVRVVLAGGVPLYYGGKWIFQLYLSLPVSTSWFSASVHDPCLEPREEGSLQIPDVKVRQSCTGVAFASCIGSTFFSPYLPPRCFALRSAENFIVLQQLAPVPGQWAVQEVGLSAHAYELLVVGSETPEGSVDPWANENLE